MVKSSIVAPPKMNNIIVELLSTGFLHDADSPSYSQSITDFVDSSIYLLFPTIILVSIS